MTPQQIQLIQDSWNKVVPIKEQAAGLFYGKLFELDPSARPLFKTELKEQGRKLMMMLNTVVTSLQKLDQLVPAVQALGVKHVGYGIREQQYDTVGQALIWTLEKGLGKDFTEDVKAAWVDAYTTLATVMKEAARQAQTA